MLSIGIVGLPNVGKSTLFNALLKRQAALVANYPFTTIEPNIGMVDVPDERPSKILEFVKSDNPQKEIDKKIIPAVVKFYDIAGLVKGAHKGEGLGNEFLGHIRGVDAIAHVIRSFENTNVVKEGSVDPKTDTEIVNTELILSDIKVLEGQIEKSKKEVRQNNSRRIRKRLVLCEKILEVLNKGELASALNISDEDKILAKDLNLLSLKPQVYVLNVSESKLEDKNTQKDVLGGKDSVLICAKLEADLASFDEKERKEYLLELGVEDLGLNLLIKKCYEMLGLITFLTIGAKEIRAWTIPAGTKASKAAGIIHTDFERGFISAEVVSYETLSRLESIKKAKEKGLMRLEGKEYVVEDGDVILFRFSV